MATHFLSPIQALPRFQLSLFRKILYTYEKNKKNNEKQNSENSMPVLWKIKNSNVCNLPPWTTAVGYYQKLRV